MNGGRYLPPPLGGSDSSDRQRRVKIESTPTRRSGGVKCMPLRISRACPGSHSEPAAALSFQENPLPVTPKIVHLIAAARPNFMKVAPLYHALAGQAWCRPLIVHTGQHYDANMSDAFFADLRLPEPAHHLEVGSGSHAEQTGRTMIAYEAVCQRERPGVIVVVGDVNATAACAMLGAKLWIPVVHLEAGLRSRDRRMPEEINRLVTD